MIVHVVVTLESGCEAGGYKRAWKNGLAGRYQGQVARTRSGLDSVARGQCQFDEEAQSQIDSGILSLSHHHLLAFSGPTDASKPSRTKPWVGRKSRWGCNERTLS